jgi:hypothetical protein
LFRKGGKTRGVDGRSGVSERGEAEGRGGARSGLPLSEVAQLPLTIYNYDQISLKDFTPAS